MNNSNMKDPGKSIRARLSNNAKRDNSDIWESLK
jgi:hypothetical protein